MPNTEISRNVGYESAFRSSKKSLGPDIGNPAVLTILTVMK